MWRKERREMEEDRNRREGRWGEKRKEEKRGGKSQDGEGRRKRKRGGSKMQRVEVARKIDKRRGRKKKKGQMKRGK